MQKWHKQMNLQFARIITYRLWKGQGRNSVSIDVCLSMAKYIQTILAQDEQTIRFSHPYNIPTICKCMNHMYDTISEWLCNNRA